MYSSILSLQAIGARLARYSCPRGTAGQVHRICLQQQFPCARRSIVSETALHHENKGTPLKGNGMENTNPAESHVHAHFHELNPPQIKEHMSTGKPQVGPDDAFHTHQTPSQVRKKRSYFFDLLFEDPGLESSRLESREAFSLQRLYNALETGDPFNVIQALPMDSSYEDLVDAVQTIPETTFAEILRCLDPEQALEEYNTIFREIGAYHSAYLASMAPKLSGTMSPIAMRFMHNMELLLQARRSCEFEPKLQYFKYMLRFCRVVGSPATARAVWSELSNFSYSPDLDCYNNYFATLAWSDLKNPYQRQLVMVTQRHLRYRASEPPPELQGQRAGILGIPPELQSHRVGKLGIKEVLTSIFNEMVNNYITGDEETFCLMMVGQAREGDLDGVKTILRRVWNIDVDQVMNGNENTTMPVQRFAIDSPFYPSKTLLLTLAHCFGINNRIPIALRLVDYVSQEFSVPISVTVWEELLERTFTLTSPSGGARRETREIFNAPEKYLSKDTQDPLSLTAVTDLWATFVNPPYSIQPTMSMYDKVIGNLRHQKCFADMLELMEEGRQLHIESVGAYRQSLETYSTYLAQAACRRKSVNVPGAYLRRLLFLNRDSCFRIPTSPRLVRMEREVARRRLRMHRNRQYLRRWCRIFIDASESNLRYNQEFFVHELPRMLFSWRLFLPRTIEYNFPTGHLSFSSQMTSINGARYKAFARSLSRRTRTRIQRIRQGRELERRLRRGMHPKLARALRMIEAAGEDGKSFVETPSFEILLPKGLITSSEREIKIC